MVTVSTPVFPVAGVLRKVNLGLEATIMKSRKGLPKALKEAEIKKGQNGILPEEHSCTAVERQEEPVAAEQQAHCSGGKTSNRLGNEKMKQLAVDYNKHKQEGTSSTNCYIGLWSTGQ
jgi:hypothetical protein